MLELGRRLQGQRIAVERIGLCGFELLVLTAKIHTQSVAPSPPAPRVRGTPRIMRRDDDDEELDGGTVAPPKHTDDDEEEALDGGVVFAAVPTAAVKAEAANDDNEEEELDGGTMAAAVTKRAAPAPAPVPAKRARSMPAPQEEELDGGVVFAAVPTAAVKAEATNDDDEEEELDGGIMAADLFGLDNSNYEKADVRSQWLPPVRVAGGRITCTKRRAAVTKRAAPAPAPASAKQARSMPAPPAAREARILAAFEMETGGGDEIGFAAAAAQAPPSSAASAFSASMAGGSIAARMMANMGFKAGAGLGREEQGVTAAIDASGQSDTRQGLGFEGLRGQGWNMAQAKAAPLGDEELDPCPKPVWMGTSAQGPPDVDTLRRWLVEGPRIESIDNETEHCEPAVLRAMLQRKSSLDHIPHDARKAFNDARTRANPFEALKKASAAWTSSDGPLMALGWPLG